MEFKRDAEFVRGTVIQVLDDGQLVVNEFCTEDVVQTLVDPDVTALARIRHNPLRGAVA